MTANELLENITSFSDDELVHFWKVSKTRLGSVKKGTDDEKLFDKIIRAIEKRRVEIKKELEIKAADTCLDAEPVNIDENVSKEIKKVS